MKLIWYIDRDEQIGKVVERELPKLTDGYAVLIINDLIVIDEKLEERLPDIVFIDSAIALQDEAALIKDLRTKKNAQKIPFVLIGSDVRLEDAAKGLETDFLKKPFDMQQLLDKAQEVLKK